MRFIALFALSGCAITAPPSAFTGAVPTTVATPAATTVTASGDLLFPSLALQHTAPLASTGALVGELRAQLAPSHVGGTPALWLRTGGSRPEGLHFGARLGAAVGVGDALGLTPFQLGWVGPQLHVQLASRVGPRTDVGVTLGSEYTWPVWTPVDTVCTGRSCKDVGYLPGAWTSLSGFVAAPTGEKGPRIAVGAGLSTYTLVWMPVPVLTVGVQGLPGEQRARRPR